MRRKTPCIPLLSLYFPHPREAWASSDEHASHAKLTTSRPTQPTATTTKGRETTPHPTASARAGDPGSLPTSSTSTTQIAGPDTSITASSSNASSSLPSSSVASNITGALSASNAASGSINAASSDETRTPSKPATVQVLSQTSNIYTSVTADPSFPSSSSTQEPAGALSSNSQHLSSGAIAAIVLGMLLGLLLAVAVVKRLRKPSRSREDAVSFDPVETPLPWEKPLSYSQDNGNQGHIGYSHDVHRGTSIAAARRPSQENSVSFGRPEYASLTSSRAPRAF